MTIPNLVTGAMSGLSKLVKTGHQRGMKYEIWHDPWPANARRLTAGGVNARAHGNVNAGKYYSAVVYSRYGENLEFSEPEQIGLGKTPEEATRIASDYIERMWRHEIGMPHRRRRRTGMAMENPMNLFSNPLSSPGKTALLIAGAVAVAGTIAVVATRKSSAAQSSGPQKRTVTLSDNNTTVNANIGDTIVISLPAIDPSTGFRWAVEGGNGIPDDNIVSSTEREEGTTIGAVTTWTLKAEKKGSIQILAGTISPGGGSTVKLSFMLNIAGGAVGLTKNPDQQLPPQPIQPPAQTAFEWTDSNWVAANTFSPGDRYIFIATSQAPGSTHAFIASQLMTLGWRNVSVIEAQGRVNALAQKAPQLAAAFQGKIQGALADGIDLNTLYIAEGFWTGPITPRPDGIGFAAESTPPGT